MRLFSRNMIFIYFTFIFVAILAITENSWMGIEDLIINSYRNITK